MIDFTKKESRVKNFFKKNGFYLALACCLLASGVAAWRTLGTGAESEIEKKPITSQSDLTVPNSGADNDLFGGDKAANAEHTGEAKSETDTEASETEPTEEETEAPSNEEPASMVNNELNTPYQSFYMMPCGTQITQDYSNGELVYSETMDDWRSHNGVDFKAGAGAKVKAINDGIVVDVYEDALWGTVVEIDHGGKLVAKYCGLGKNPPVQKGTSVKMNDDIGVVNTPPAEASEGSHLHFEVRIDGKLVDPLAAMGKAQ